MATVAIMFDKITAKNIKIVKFYQRVGNEVAYIPEISGYPVSSQKIFWHLRHNWYCSIGIGTVLVSSLMKSSHE